jgi:hypothetical protein
MKATQKRIGLILFLMAAIYFAAFWAPNAVASEDLAMVTAFEPDEGKPLPFLLDMLQPADSLGDALRNFISYGYFFYGFPFFALSGLTLLPQALAGDLGDIPQVMVTLRQFANLLPMLLAMLIMVWLQTEFRGYKSILVFAWLLAIPAVVANNLWWHPDGLAILFAMLALWALVKDDLRFGGWFYAAAALVGLAAQTKGIGFYFFLAIAWYLWLGYRQRGLALGRLALAALGFLAAMAAAYFLSNPILMTYPPARAQFFNILQTQSALLTEGYEVVYRSGFGAAAPIVSAYYGGWLLPLAMLCLTVWGALRGPRRRLHQLVLAWFIPITVFVFFFSHFKYQYWLPVILPLYSALALALPDNLDEARRWWREWRPQALALGAVLLLALGQFLLYVRADVQRYTTQLQRAEGSPALAFHDEVQAALAPLPAGEYHVYHDVGLYLPPQPGWTTEDSFELLTYDYIRSGNFDILLLSQQRILDYLSPEAEGIDPAEFAAAQAFYRDADAGGLDGFVLLYRDAFGLVFVKEGLYAVHFAQ